MPSKSHAEANLTKDATTKTDADSPMHATKQRLIGAGLQMLLKHGYNDMGIQALLAATSTVADSQGSVRQTTRQHPRIHRNNTRHSL